MLVHWIWFATRQGLGDRVKAALLQHFRDPEDIFFADSGAFEPIQELTQEGAAALQDKNLGPSEEILEACRRKKIQVLTCRDAAYPRRLWNIPDPPPVLYYKGCIPELDALPTIAVVGTRKASAYGLTTAKRMGYQLGSCGGAVVSGMASGIDAMAMSGALTAGGPVVGVLGCGADQIYPLSNRALFRDTEAYGCILSEFPPGTPPLGRNFPRRNRIISGLSNGVLVVEAPETSGALITARQAADQGRDVFVVPGNIDVPSCAGSNKLLRDGAIMASCGWDILSEYEGLYPEKIHREDAPSRQRAYPDEVSAQEPKPAKPPKIEKKPEVKKELTKEAIDKEAPSSYSDLDATLKKLSQEEQAVVSALKNGERLVDDVIAETGLTTGKVLAMVTMLELKGVIKRLPGKRIKLN